MKTRTLVALCSIVLPMALLAQGVDPRLGKFPEAWPTHYGDYSGLAFFAGTLFPVWADGSNSAGTSPDGSLDVYTTQGAVT